jgi:hypothetical protein
MPAWFAKKVAHNYPLGLIFANRPEEPELSYREVRDHQGGDVQGSHAVYVDGHENFKRAGKRGYTRRVVRIAEQRAPPHRVAEIIWPFAALAD